jgi:hypothetical protein
MPSELFEGLATDRVVFSIDDWYDLRKLARFLRHMADCRALGKLSGEFKVLQGCYKGVPEVSFMCSRQDFNAYVVHYGWFTNQESCLVIDESNNACLVSSECTEGIGQWTQVSQDQKGDSWTYDPKDNSWWACI